MGLPHSHVASKKSDSIFSSSDSGSQHVRSSFVAELLCFGESLTLDVPVKVAIHPSCRDAVVEHFKKHPQPHYMTRSPSENLCFNPNMAASKPDYGTLVEALLVHSLVERAGRHVIHVADLGARHPLSMTDEEHRSGRLGCIFRSIARVRATGVRVEVAQLDVAFNARAALGDLPRLSCRKLDSGERVRRSEKFGNWKGVFVGATVDNWALHSIAARGVPDPSSAPTLPAGLQQGTARLKQREWQQHDVVPLDPASFREEYCAEECPRLVVAISELYRKAEREGLPSLLVNRKDVYSCKMYSTVAHFVLQDRRRLLLTMKQLAAAPGFTMVKLQRLVAHLERLLSGVLDSGQQHGFKARLEVSVRPTLQPSDLLRTQGHLVDLLSHVCLGLQDLTTGQHKLTCTMLPVVRVHAKATRLLRDMRQLLRHRASAPFSQLYPAASMSSFLTSHISMAQVLAGVAASYDLRFVRSWLAAPTRHDPFQQAASLLSGDFTAVGDTLHQERSSQPSAAASREVTAALQSCQLTEQGKTELADYLTKRANGEAPSAWCGRMSLRDKLVLSSTLSSLVHPAVARALTGSEGGSDQAPLDDGEGMEEDEDVPGGLSLPPYLRSEEAPEEDAPAPAGVPVLEHVSPLQLVMSRLDLLSGVFQPHSPISVTRLCQHVRLCHEQGVTLPGNGSRLDTLAADNAGLLRAAEESGVTTPENLQVLCIRLGVPHHGHLDTQSLMNSLCLHYWHPSPGVSFGVSLLEDAGRTDRRSLRFLDSTVNDLLRLNAVDELPAAPLGSRWYYRHSDGTRVEVTDEEHAVTSEPPDFDQPGLAKWRCPDLCELLARAEGDGTPEDTDGAAFRQSLADFLHSDRLRNRHIEDIFLNQKAVSSQVFRGVSTLSQLQEKHKFCLVPTEESLLSPERLHVPTSVLVPLACLKLQQPVVLYDFDRSCTTLHSYQGSPARVVTREFSSTDVTPVHESHHIKLCAGEYTMVPGCTRLKTVPAVPATGCPLCACLRGAPRTGHQTFSRHPAGKFKRGTSGHASICKLLEARYGDQLSLDTCPDDALGLVSYTRELARRGVSLARDFLDEPALELVGGPVEADSWFGRVSRGDASPSRAGNAPLRHFWSLCVTVCAKYKVCFAVWVDGGASGGQAGSGKHTQLVLYSPTLEKVTAMTLPAFSHVSGNHSVLYLKASVKPGRHPTFGHWDPYRTQHPVDFRLPLTALTEHCAARITGLLASRQGTTVCSATTAHHPLFGDSAPRFYRLDAATDPLAPAGPTVPNVMVAFPLEGLHGSGHQLTSTLCFIFSDLVPEAVRERQRAGVVMRACGNDADTVRNSYKCRQCVLTLGAGASCFLPSHLLYVVALLVAFQSPTTQQLESSLTALFSRPSSLSRLRSWLYDCCKQGWQLDDPPPL